MDTLAIQTQMGHTNRTGLSWENRRIIGKPHLLGFSTSARVSTDKDQPHAVRFPRAVAVRFLIQNDENPDPYWLFRYARGSAVRVAETPLGRGSALSFYKKVRFVRFYMGKGFKFDGRASIVYDELR